ncbi:MAG: AbrB/MazE/SpoVT family DNA-binding domain-containing protein [Candidatus Woesearchaeota archaeon]
MEAEMVIETIKMSSKGQVVIPRGIRDEINADEGTVFAVIGSKDSVVLKKIATPSKEELINELGIIAREGAKRAKKLGIKEDDVSDLVHKSRKAK